MAKFSHTNETAGQPTVVYAVTPHPKRFITIDCDGFVDHWRCAVIRDYQEDHGQTDDNVIDIISNLVEISGCAPVDLGPKIAEFDFDWIVNVTDVESNL